MGQDKITFVREKIDDLVHKEVQLKLNNIAASSDMSSPKSEEVLLLKSQVEHAVQEKQAYILISNDIQGLLQLAMNQIQQPPSQVDPSTKLPFVAQKLSEVNNLVASL